ncbi:MAG: flagellar hook-basal body complex protein FliE [Planctomycetes bacterium RBG_16_64_10]|nr:MAG: flagellar hook-basal body complex protein FliE [Planctomycetes bacterium RBG_16_64_10]
MEPIPPINLQPPLLPAPVSGIGQPAVQGESFKDFLLDSIRRVNTIQSEADRAVESLFTGGDISPAEVLTAVQKADLAFRMMMQARNKLIQVYHEIQNLQI